MIASYYKPHQWRPPDHGAVYRPSFHKHLHNLAVSGFYARDLDADDHAFLEQVRVRRSANGELPNTNVVLLEELEFWHLPYAIAPDIERRAGPLPRRTPETAEQRRARLVRSNAWHARRAIGRWEREAAKAEMEREWREQEKAKETRKLRELLSDEMWEAAAPWKNKETPVYKAFKIQQAKLRETAAKAARERKLELARAKERERREREQALAREEKQRERKMAKFEFEAQQARRILAEVRQLDQETSRQAMPKRPSAAGLKALMLNLLRHAPTPLTFEQLLRQTGCLEPEFLNQCLTEMVRDGQLLDLGSKKGAA